MYRRLWKRGDLRFTERAIVVRGLIRAIGGMIVCRVREARSAPTTRWVHQVWLDGSGGGDVHARLLVDEFARGPRAARQLPLDPDNARSPARCVRTAWRLLLSIRRRGIVHAHGVRAAMLALPAVKVRRARLVVTVHGLHVERRDASAPTRWMARRVLRAADSVLVLSESDRRAVVDGGYAMSDRVKRVRAAIADPEPRDRTTARRGYDVAGDEVLVAWVGRLAPEKDPVTFVRTFDRLDPAASIRAVVAGGGPSMGEVARLAAETPSIDLAGWLEEIGSLFAAADVFVSSSRWEGFPLAPLEAAAAQLPLILTDVPGNRDVVEAGVPAILVPPGDPQALATAIEELASDPERRAEMGMRGAEVVRSTFTPGALAEDVLEVYRSLG
jgi:glycosyltransferase involved in cell wall biosynthesis